MEKSKATPEWKNFTRYKPAAELPHQKGETGTRAKLNNDTVSPWNFIDLNKILLQHEIDVLKKYWFAWKQSVNKNDRGFVKRKIKGKRCHKNQLETQYFMPEYNTTSDSSLANDPYGSAKKHFIPWKEFERSDLEMKSIIRPKTKGAWANSEGKPVTSETTGLLHSRSASHHNEGNEVSHKYMNVWKAEKNDVKMATCQDDPTYKIEQFLNAIKAAKMKTGKKTKSKSSIVQLSRPKRGKSLRTETSILNELTKVGDEFRSLPGDSYTAQNTASNTQADSLDSERNKSMAFIKEEVDASLAEAHTLLENTIAASYKGNCTRRKFFKHPKKKGSPIPAELPADSLVERMKMRELDRAERWQRSRERKEKLESEKAMRMIEEEREKEREEEMTKKLKLLKLREKKIETLLREKRLEEVRERYHMLNMKALKHYDKTLLHKGMQAFTNELKLLATLEGRALSHYEKKLSQRIFSHWNNFVHLSMNMHISAAEFQKKHILRKYFKIWSKLQREYVLNKQAAIDFCDMLTQERAFLRWNRYTCDVLIEQNSNNEIADQYYNRCLLKKSIHCWKRLPAAMESERARERIKNSFTMKVLEIFPDYCPQPDNEA
ncbi:uncharacterized protein LOC124157100 isoform X2 [Ischnura elegans]|uniref:uncharacterized protein LOC124157100 isoform X2 n=1 Tax=Ischnura elegans TaxID=197161 RepID=UPI001ED86739|nr:uncharacterized protein LOC124157100 isoform X2 [Ischnura elegans]